MRSAWVRAGPRPSEIVLKGEKGGPTETQKSPWRWRQRLERSGHRSRDTGSPQKQKEAGRTPPPGQREPAPCPLLAGAGGLWHWENKHLLF